MPNFLLRSSHRLAAMVAVGMFFLAPPLLADSNAWSVSLKVGEASIDENFGDENFGWRVDDEDTSLGVAVGYTPFRYLGFEAAYHDLGTYRGLPNLCEVCTTFNNDLLIPIHPGEADFTALSFSLVPRWPITERFALYGKVGVFDWEGETTPLFPGQSVEDPSDTEFLTGVGARYGLPSGLGVQLEYEASELYENLSLGATWRF